MTNMKDCIKNFAKKQTRKGGYSRIARRINRRGSR